MTLFTHVAPRPDPLVSVLCDHLASPLDDPFAREVIAVPTRGIERWLTQRIASELAVRGAGDGICANVDFPSPWRLVRDALLSLPQLADTVSAWQGPDFIAHVLAAIDDNLDEPWMRLIARYVAAGDIARESSANRLSAAHKVDRLFSRYARRRPDMIRCWAHGDHLGPDGQPIADSDRWQPLLWQAVREQIAVASLPEMLPAALDPIRDGSAEPDLPPRLSVYGLTATDPLDLEVLLALSWQRDVHLYLLHPSPALWETTAGHVGPNVARRDDTTEDLADHPLLKVWGRDSRELQLVLADQGLTATPTDDEGEAGTTLLGQIQRDITANSAPTIDTDLAARVVSGDDRSVQIHVGHGDRRQAEVLRDAILHLLVADPSLEPRDIVIMTPDLAAFAPLLEAAFPSIDSGSKDALPDLRLRVADRSSTSTNPLVRFAANLMAIVDGRLEAGVVRELVGRPVVQERFGFDTEAAGELVGLIDEATIAWGLDGEDREEWGAGLNDERTWARGMERVLAGVFFADDDLRVVESTAPLEGVEGHEAVMAGRLASIIERITAARSILRQSRTMSEWAGSISASTRLLAAPAWGDEWQLDHLERLLAEAFPAHDGDGAGVDPIISLAEARLAVAGWTDDRPSPLHFRTGDVTVCTLAPMRSVPYRVVCLLGMDEDRFPRGSGSDGDDLLLRHEIVGDRSRSAEDRQLLLDAVMAAGETLIVTYSGRDELTNADLPPAVPIAELTDTLEEMVGEAAVEALTTSHPLQAFSDQNFTPGALRVPGPWAFDAMNLDGALAIRARGNPTSVPSGPWSQWEEPDPTHVDDLITFLQNPAKRFLRSRLGFSVPRATEGADDTLPADLGGLERWAVQDRLLAGVADGHDVAELAARAQASDALPPGDLGVDDLEEAIEAVSTLWSAATSLGFDPGALVPISGVVDLDAGRVHGTVRADRDRAHLATLTVSTLRGKHRLRAFTELVFLSALDPSREWTAFLFGKKSKDKYMKVTIGPIGANPAEREAHAIDHLADLLDLRRVGMQEPLLMPCETGYVWQRAVSKNRDKAFRDAVGKWENDRFSPEADDPAHYILFADIASTGALLDTGFEHLAERLWAPIFSLSEEETL